ncbi:hypothetical protein L6R52_38030 [Myxococcota bacterium]|nr:hypothetical protein [Myxococcota bacterium]
MSADIDNVLRPVTPRDPLAVSAAQAAIGAPSSPAQHEVRAQDVHRSDAPGLGLDVPARRGRTLELARDVLLGLVDRGAAAAVLLGLVGCSTVAPQGASGVRGAPLGHTPPPYDQTDYPTLVLGEGRYTIASSGCLLTSLAMASVWHHGRTELTPPRANRLVLANDGFSGSGLELPRAAPALGLRVTDREEVTTSTRARLAGELDRSLAADRPVVLGVDYQPGDSSAVSDADHFILAYRRLGPGRYAAMDPAGGRSIELVADANGKIVYAGAEGRTISEMIFVDRAPFVRDPSAIGDG